MIDYVMRKEEINERVERMRIGGQNRFRPSPIGYSLMERWKG